jgi:hypothetical protein
MLSPEMRKESSQKNPITNGVNKDDDYVPWQSATKGKRSNRHDKPRSNDDRTPNDHEMALRHSRSVGCQSSRISGFIFEIQTANAANRLPDETE